MFRLIFSVVVLTTFIVSCYGMNCSGTVNGKFYDLSSLTGVDVSVVPVAGAYNYYINVCGAVQNSTCSEKGAAFACQVRKSPLDQFEAVLAYSNDTAHPPPPVWSTSSVNATAGVKLTFINGDQCNLKQRVAIIDFHCDKSGTPPTILESPQCTFNIDYPTPAVCPQEPHSSSSSSSSTGEGSSTGHHSSTGIDSSSTGHQSSSTGVDSSSSSPANTTTPIPTMTPTNTPTLTPTSSPAPSTSSSSDERLPYMMYGFLLGVGVAFIFMGLGWYMRGRSQRQRQPDGDRTRMLPNSVASGYDTMN